MRHTHDNYLTDYRYRIEKCSIGGSTRNPKYGFFAQDCSIGPNRTGRAMTRVYDTKAELLARLADNEDREFTRVR